MSRRTLKTWLFAATSGVALAAGAAQAQTISQPTPPEHYTLDERGVDLVSGHFNFQTTEVMIGQPGAGGLSLTRGRIQLGWRDNNQGTLTVSGSTYTVVSGLGAEEFTLSGGVFTPKSNNGSTLTQSGTTYSFTTSSGTVLRYTTTYCFTSAGVACTNKAALYEIVTPNGETTNYHYVTQTYLRSVDSNGNPVTGTVVRLQSITNNRGYRLHYTYKSNTMSGSGTLNTKVGNWLAVASVTGANSAVDYCAPTAFSCTYTRTWPSIAYTSTVGGPITAATDQSGRVTQYIYGSSGNLTGIRYPGSTTNDVTVDESGVTGRVSTLTDATGTWNYSYLDGDTNRTVTTTGPSGEEVTVLSNTVIGQPIQITTRTSASTTSTTYFAYDAQRRLTRTTGPEGDYVEQTLDARGNVTQVTATPKPGSGLSPITSSATFAATCTNPVTCNLPSSTTDTSGHVTDYTWDSVHGGPLTITEPAPSSGADRPQTRITYAAQTAYYKNSSGVIVAAPTSVILPTVVSACVTGTSCSGAANEVRTTVAYGLTGVANNLLPASISQGSGANPTMAVTALTYTVDGDVETIDGPLPGTSDTARYRYDNARQTVGVIEPAPDGGGEGLNRARRLTYNSRGQVTLSETGTTPGYTDANWASFNPLVRGAAVYDDRGRPLVISQQSGAGITVSVQQVSYDASGRPNCTAVRMNPSAWGSLPTSACTATMTGGDGPDRIALTTYDAAGRPLSATSGVVTTSVTYGAGGVVSMTDGNGNVSIQEYDGFNRPTVLRFPEPDLPGTSASDYEQVTYDIYGRTVSRRDRAGLTTTLALDNLGRVTTVDAPSGMDVAYTYDNLGRVLTTASGTYDNVSQVLTTAGGGQTLTNVWDSLSRLTSETGPLGAMSYWYDERGAVTRIIWPDTFYAQYDRDVHGSVTKIRENGATSGPAVLATYTYNNLGQTTGITRGDGTTTAYGYDAAGRMTSLSHNMAGSASDVSFTYTWNPAGQIASRTVSNAAYVYAPNTGSTSYENNGLNQVTSAGGTTVTYDANKNTASALGSSYDYDAANRLTSATIGGTAYTFGYDPGGRLYSSAGGRFQYVGVQLVGEYDSSGVLTTRHVPGPGLDQPVATSIGSARHQQIADERGSVVGVADAYGSVSVNRYDEYGVPSAGNRFQYTGQAWMAPGIYNYRARAYAPQLGRFLQADPIGYAAGPNVYGYVSGDPVNLVDPFGLQEDPAVPIGDVSVTCWRRTRCVPPATDTTLREPRGGAGGGINPFEPPASELDEVIVTGTRPSEDTCRARLSSSFVETTRAVLGTVQFVADLGVVGSAATGVGAPVAGAFKVVGFLAEGVLGAVNLYEGVSTGDYSALQAQGATFATRAIPGSMVLRAGGQMIRRRGSQLRNAQGQFRSANINRPGANEAAELAMQRAGEAAAQGVFCD